MSRVELYIKDLVYGANDGIVTTFAVVASVVGANLSSQVILVVGMASLVADGFSMAASSFLGSQSERAVAENGGSGKDEPRPLVSSICTFVAFVSAGFVPLLPYVFADYVDALFLYTTLATGAVLALVGSARALVTGRHPVRAGLEMILLGGAAAAIAYAVGRQVGVMTG